MARVLVTGASGFIGAPVVRELLARGHEVHGIGRRPRAQPGGAAWSELDLGEDVAVEAVLEQVRPERLVHLAWYVEHGRFWESAENVAWVERSLRLLRAFARAGGERALLLGSCAEYDWRDAARPLRELSSLIAPATLYGTSKDALRRLASAYGQSAGIELAWGRVFFLYGPREDPARLVPSVIRALLAGESIETSAGLQERDLMHVADVAGALVALLESAVTGPVNIASGVAVRVSEVVGLIAAQIGRPELVLSGALPERPGDPALLVADTQRLFEMVGYRPRWSLGDGLADTIAWWRRQERSERPGEA